ncbi:hypothetical protein EKO27_g9752 [Xylaria grammica]|uniref:Serine protease n=1 Tax=Xylaria grammica TaxID=363999 RepID=A0A439CT70_9PEZI|nr:hypothetical protein EKO27_g9752 [Xylaria grammica]
MLESYFALFSEKIFSRSPRRTLASTHSPTIDSPAPGGDDLWERCRVTNYVGSLSNVGFPGLAHPNVRIVAWRLVEPTAPIQREGIITSEERELVGRNQLEKENRIFRITSAFKGPEGLKYISGTAFAIGKFYAATSGHLVCDQTLGPAISVVLHGDQRSDGIAIGGKKCVAATCSIEWIKSYRIENDVCVVSVAEPFSAGVHTYRVTKLAEESPSINGVVIGFPVDLPVDHPGKQLIKCSGTAKGYEEEAIFRVKHEVNTLQAGNSGSPVFSGEEVVAIHSAYIDGLGKNYAAPIDRNGNMIDQFRGVLNHMKYRRAALPRGILYLGAAKHGGYRTQGVLVFGEDTITLPTEGVAL